MFIKHSLSQDREDYMFFSASSTCPVFKECKQCLHSYELYEYKDLPKNLGISAKIFDENLCLLCLQAKVRGFHRFWCRGCDTEVKGSFRELRSLLNVYGKSFCQDCRNGFFGIYNSANPALNAILVSISEKRKLRSKTVWFSDKQQELMQQQSRYNQLVRRLSKAQLRKHQHLLNPKGHVLGPSGQRGAYHLDHIVPVTQCWEYYVPAECAASFFNLQIIPWFVNISRGNYFSLSHLVGWPLRSKRK